MRFLKRGTWTPFDWGRGHATVGTMFYIPEGASSAYAIHYARGYLIGRPYGAEPAREKLTHLPVACRIAGVSPECQTRLADALRSFPGVEPTR